MDRHLFALKTLAESEGIVPRLFTSRAYAKLAHIILSTSTLSSDALENGGVLLGVRCSDAVLSSDLGC